MYDHCNKFLNMAHFSSEFGCSSYKDTHNTVHEFFQQDICKVMYLFRMLQ